MKGFVKAMAVAALAALSMAGSASQAAITYYHNDIAGSPLVATNEAGQVVWRESYRPYGDRTVNAAAANANKVWFTSRRQDDSGLVYMGARYYDPVVGRFISTDPAGLDEMNLHSFNRYAYANNNPYKYVDPDGRAGVLATTAAGAEIGTLAWPGPGTVIGGAVGFAVGAWGTWQAVKILNESAQQPSSGNNDASLQRPAGVPENWVEQPTKGEGGRQWVNPDNPGDRVRVMPGNPDSPNPSQREPYVRDVRNGNQWLDVNGNRVEGKQGRNSPDTHIPVGDYAFKP